MRGHVFLEVAVAGQEFESRLDEGLRIQGNEIGLVVVDALMVGGVERAGFFRIEREIAEALAGTHFSWAQDQVIGVHGADRVAVYLIGHQLIGESHQSICRECRKMRVVTRTSLGHDRK
jgi:hypothetical protein